MDNRKGTVQTVGAALQAELERLSQTTGLPMPALSRPKSGGEDLERLSDLYWSKVLGTGKKADTSRFTSRLTPPRCPFCNDAGMVRPEKMDSMFVGDPGFGRLVECPMCHDNSSKRAFLNSLANLPASLKSANFTHDDFLYTTAARVTAAPLAQGLVDGRRGWLTLWGGYGTGKSYVAAAAVNYALERGLPARFWEMAALLDHLRDAYDPRRGPGAFSQLFHDICEVDLLVLDEVDVFKPTDWAYAQFRQLVSYRYSNVTRLATIWVLNPEPCPGARGFPAELDFLASRMSEFEIIKMDDGDIRPLR